MLRAHRVTPRALTRATTGSVAKPPYHPHIQHAEIQTTQIYLHADLALKEAALAKAAPIDSKPGRYRPPDPLLRFLEGL